MSADSNSEGGSQSFAERLREKHNNAHSATIEEVSDEEDLRHPPPSSSIQGPVLEETNKPLSEKAQGKQKAAQEPVVPTGGIDTKSETAFPSLGGGPKPRATGPVASAWGAKKPAAATNGATTGAPKPVSVSPQQSGSPNALAAARSQAPVSIPGRHVEQVHLMPDQMLKRTEMKKPVQDIVRDVNRRSKANVDLKYGAGGGLIFEGTGPVDAVRQALKDVVTQIGSRQSVKIPIPLSVRPHIIGRQGVTIQDIQRKSGARINFPKADDLPAGIENDEDATIHATVEGDAVSAELARKMIQDIVDARTSTLNVRLRDIPPEFYPFIAGPHSSRVKDLQENRSVNISIPHYYAWTGQPPPATPGPSGALDFRPHPTHHIQISGDRNAVLEARAEIERHAEQLQRELTLEQVPVEGQHRFIAGANGAELHNLLEQTGCAFLIPPPSQNSEDLIVIGPRQHIGKGVDAVQGISLGISTKPVNVAQMLQNNQAHARMVTRYLKERQAIRQVEEQFNTRIVLPGSEDEPMVWTVSSREGKNLFPAHSTIKSLMTAYPQARFRNLDLDPFYHELLRERHSRNLRQNHGVHLLLPRDAAQASNLVLVHEGSSETGPFNLNRQAPTPEELATAKKALQEAEADIMNIIGGRQKISARGVDAPSKFHEKIRRFIRTEQSKLPENVLPIQIFPQATKEQQIFLRGPEDRLDNFARELLAFIEQEQKDELERGHVTSFDFPQKYANFLIGRKGENINKLREEFDVDIQVDNGKVKITGPPAKAELAKGRILSIGKKLEDEATHILKIKPQYHPDLIGAKGSLVNRLQERYNVRVQFPRSASFNDAGSIADGSDAGTPRQSRGNQAADEVVVRGPKKGADACKDEILSLLQYTIDNSHNAIVSVAQNQVPSLIGQGGREMDSIRQQTGAKIDVPSSTESSDAKGRVELKIKGTKKQVDDAKKLLEARAKIFDESISRTIVVNKKHHSSLIVAGGSNLRKIYEEAGGTEGPRGVNKTIRFPPRDSPGSEIRVEGHKSLVEKIVAAIEAFAGEKDSQVEEFIEVAPNKHSLLIGPGGSVRKSLESEFNVTIDVPKKTATGASRSQVKVVGQGPNVEKAKGRIAEIAKEQEHETIQVPRTIHFLINDNGKFPRRLRNDHNVIVDHGGRQPRSQQAAPNAGRVNGGSAPLITDNADDSGVHSWNVVENLPSEEPDVPWILRGKAEDVAVARELIAAGITEAQSKTHTGYLILPDPSAFRLIVGPGGSTIRNIRTKTGCLIDVPDNKAKSEAIEVIGSKDGVEKVKDMILDVVRNKASRD